MLGPQAGKCNVTLWGLYCMYSMCGQHGMYVCMDVMACVVSMSVWSVCLSGGLMLCMACNIPYTTFNTHPRMPYIT